MKISAVISEFNPMHSGHDRLIEEAKKNGATHVVSIMSGNFVQRGDCAVYSKWDRAVDAVNNGVDLVIALPCAKCLSSASVFASAGVEIADKCGCVDELFFGSECGDIDQLKLIAGIMTTERFKNTFEEEYSKGISYPAARQMAFEKIGESELAVILKNPNDILGIEYIRAINELGSAVNPVCFQRQGEVHDSLNDEGEHLSGALLRKKIFEGRIPQMHTVYCLKNAERAVLYKLREMTADDLKNIPDVDEGLENRIRQAVLRCNSIDSIIDSCKTKRYTYSRLRRIILCALLSICRMDVYSEISHIRVLAFNENGREVLRIMRESAKVPVIMKHSDAYKTGDENIVRDYEKEIFSSDVFALMSDNVGFCSKEQKENAIFLKDIDKRQII